MSTGSYNITGRGGFHGHRTLHKKWSFTWRISLVEDIFYGKLHFLCSETWENVLKSLKGLKNLNFWNPECIINDFIKVYTFSLFGLNNSLTRLMSLLFLSFLFSEDIERDQCHEIKNGLHAFFISNVFFQLSVSVA